MVESFAGHHCAVMVLVHPNCKVGSRAVRTAPSERRHSKDREPLPEDPESPRDLIRENVPLLVAGAVLLLLGILALLIALSH